jgi:GT2 family glycosyltransferase
MFDAAWYATIEKQAIRPVNIALNTTTFQKEDYILDNLSQIQKQIFDVVSDEVGLNSLGQHLFVNVIDNGRSLDKEKIDTECIHVYGNPNVGGAGGFTRGMIETLKLRESKVFTATHVLFMDDDVEVLPESFKRTYALLSILKEDYQDYFISGAMLDSLDGVTQYEDTGFISQNKDIVYFPTKSSYNLMFEKDVLRNDLEYPMANQYGAWWYCVVPMKFISEDSMSLPIFYRGDDIEFSIRNQAKFITLNGIAVWHLPFYTKKSKALENYLVPRNSLIIQSVNGFAPEIDYLEKYRELYKKELRMFNYGAAEQVLDAIADYLQGPEYIATLNGIEVLKRESAKNEIFTDDIPKEIEKNLHTADEYDALVLNEQLLFLDTDNGHGLPDFILNQFDNQLENVAIVNQEMLDNPGKQFMKKRLIVFDTYQRKIAIRERNQNRYEELEERFQKLILHFGQEKEVVAQAYRSYEKVFHSKVLWLKYLGID